MGCKICGEKVRAHLMCNKHYKRWYRGADVEGPDRKVAILHKSHPVYAAWTNMKTRCNNPNSSQWLWYGKRGIKVCERWNTFENFYADMFPTWERGLELDRRDNNKGYEPDNCRWITHEENCQNRNPRGENRVRTVR